MVPKIVFLQSVRFSAAFVMIAMAAPKIANPTWLSAMGLGWLPPEIAWAAGLFLPWAELALGVLLLTPSLWRPAAQLTSLLLGAFLLVLVVFLVEGRSDCGCGTPDFLPKWASSPHFAIARNLFLLSGLWLASTRPCLKIIKKHNACFDKRWQ